MFWKNLLAMVRTFAAPAVVAGAVWLVPDEAMAHENHAPLPTKGVTIAGDTIMLSDKAREAIGLTTAKVEFGDIHRTVTVNARVELPWHAQAMITSLVPGKIDRVLVRPGETVVPGQELARVVSTELETLQLELLQAKAQVELARKLVDQRTALDQQGIIAGKTLLESQAKLAEESAALQIARQKLLALGLDEADSAASRTAGRAASVRLDHQPGGRHHHARRCPHRADGEPYGPPLPRRQSHDALDRRRGAGVRRATAGRRASRSRQNSPRCRARRSAARSTTCG